MPSLRSLRPAGAAAPLAVPPDLRGTWADAIAGVDVELRDGITLGELTGPLPVVLLERGT